MTKQRFLRWLILAAVSIVIANVLAYVYVVLTNGLRVSGDVAGSSDSNSITQGAVTDPNSKQARVTKSANKRQEQEIGVDVGTVTGIVYVDMTPLVSVNGVVLREGQSIHNAKVVKINADSVEFEYEGKRWSQKVGEPPSTHHTSTINSRTLPKYASVEDVVKCVAPAVVVIMVYDNTGKELGFGSGFFIGKGKILTNAHVVEDAYSAEVFSLCKTYEDVTITKLNKDIDLAVLEVRSAGEPIISLADDSDLRVGQRVLAVGNPEGCERTVSDGMISAIRSVGAMQEIQISAPISEGSSGGPLLNMEGSLIGITYGGIEEGQNLNFAVGIKTVKWFLRTPDNPVRLQEAGSYILGKVVRKWVQYIVLGILAFAAAASFLLYVLKGWYRFITTPFRRSKTLDVAVPKQELYQPVLLSSQQNSRHWRVL